MALNRCFSYPSPIPMSSLSLTNTVYNPAVIFIISTSETRQDQVPMAHPGYWQYLHAYLLSTRVETMFGFTGTHYQLHGHGNIFTCCNILYIRWNAREEQWLRRKVACNEATNFGSVLVDCNSTDKIPDFNASWRVGFQHFKALSLGKLSTTHCLYSFLFCISRNVRITRHFRKFHLI